MNTQTDDQPRRFLLGSKWRRETNPVFCVFNHAQNGNLIAQRFTDTEELPNSHSRDWKIIETAQQKIEAFAKSDWVLNVTPIAAARSHEEALELAIRKRGMVPLKLMKKGGNFDEI